MSTTPDSDSRSDDVSGPHTHLTITVDGFTTTPHTVTIVFRGVVNPATVIRDLRTIEDTFTSDSGVPAFIAVLDNLENTIVGIRTDDPTGHPSVISNPSVAYLVTMAASPEILSQNGEQHGSVTSDVSIHGAHDTTHGPHPLTLWDESGTPNLPSRDTLCDSTEHSR
jgi:hypothetical protein